MQMKHKISGQNPGVPADSSGSNRRYQKPAFRSEQVFETMALACGKVRGGPQANCRRLASNS